MNFICTYYQFFYIHDKLNDELLHHRSVSNLQQRFFMLKRTYPIIYMPVTFGMKLIDLVYYFYFPDENIYM